MFDSPWHWLVVAAVAFVLFFGWKQLPDMSRSLGRSLRIFKTEIKGMSEDDQARDAAKSTATAAEVVPAPAPVVATPVVAAAPPADPAPAPVPTVAPATPPAEAPAPPSEA